MPYSPPCPHTAVPHRSSSWPLRCSSCPHDQLRRHSPRTLPASRHLPEKTNMVRPREASPPVTSGLPPARSSDHERAPPPTSLPGAIMDIAASIRRRRWSPPPRSGQKPNPGELLVPDPAFPKLSAASHVHADAVDLMKPPWQASPVSQVQIWRFQSCSDPQQCWFIMRKSICFSTTPSYPSWSARCPATRRYWVRIPMDAYFVVCNLSHENELLAPFQLQSRPFLLD